VPQNILKCFAAEAPPRTPLGELTVLPSPLAGFGGRFAAERDKSKGGTGKGAEGRRMGRERKVEEKEEGKGK